MDSTIFITGATGLFGGALIEHYLTWERDTKIMALVRAESKEAAINRLYSQLKSTPTFTYQLELEAAKRLKVIHGDFTKPDLNLSTPYISRLQLSVTDIIHSGASVDFGLPVREARTINVEGTKNVLDFALQCRKLNAFLHVSTGHVAGKRAGLIKENEIGVEQGFLNSYEQTKAESELLVHTYMTRLPITIHRLTTIIGDYTTGYIRQFGFFHNSIRLLSKGLIPFLAGDRNGHLALIPTEYPVQAVHYLHRNNFKPGTTYHICCGPERSFTLEVFLHETVNHLSKRCNKGSLAAPEIISQEEFEKRIDDSRNVRLTAIMKALGTFIGHLTLPKVFDQTNARRDLAESGIEAPPVQSYYYKVLDECVKRGR